MGGINVGVDIDIGGATADLDELQVAVREQAAVSAINKTLAKGRTNMIRAISREYNVTAGYVRERLRIEGATYQRGKAQIFGTLSGSGARGQKRSANLIAFLEKSVTFAQAKKRAKAGTLDQLHFQIKRGARRVVIPGAFVGNKGRTVFIRRGKDRLPIDPVQTIDVPQMFNARRVNDVVRRAIEQDFPDIYEHEVQFYTSRFSQKRARGDFGSFVRSFA
jgi:hypothetical protein